MAQLKFINFPPLKPWGNNLFVKQTLKLQFSSFISLQANKSLLKVAVIFLDYDFGISGLITNVCKYLWNSQNLPVLPVVTANTWKYKRSLGLMIFAVNRLIFFNSVLFRNTFYFNEIKEKPNLGSELWDLCLTERTY